MLKAHNEQAATCALKTLLHSKHPTHLQRDALSAENLIWVYYDRSSKAKQKSWVKSTVVEAQEQYVLGRRSIEAQAMRVAYEDLRVAPNSRLNKELMALALGEELALDDIEPTTAHA